MSDTFDRIVALVEKGDVRISDHGYDELANDGLFARDIVDGVATGIVVEDCPEYHKGPSVLVFRADGDGSPIHVVWGDSVGNVIAGSCCHSLST